MLKIISSPRSTKAILTRIASILNLNHRKKQTNKVKEAIGVKGNYSLCLNELQSSQVKRTSQDCINELII